MSTDIEPHVLTRYDVKKRLGKGVSRSKYILKICQIHFSFISKAYGIVWKAIDTHNAEPVALKKIFDAFRNATDAQVSYFPFIIIIFIYYPHY